MGDEVTHEELDAAADEVSSEVEVEETSELEGEETPESEAKTEKEVEPEKPEVEDQRLRSALGRVGSLQSEVDSLKNIVGQLQSRLETDSEEEGSGIVASEEDVVAIVEKRERQKDAANKAYSDTAVNALIDIGMEYPEIDDNTYVIIHKDAEKNWKRVTGDPKQDAEINFTKAMNRHYKSMLDESAKPKNPLDKNKDVEAEGLGGGAETQVTEKTVKAPKLDQAAEDFVKRTGMKVESVQEALTGDMPAYLGGR